MPKPTGKASHGNPERKPAEIVFRESKPFERRKLVARELATDLTEINLLLDSIVSNTGKEIFKNSLPKSIIARFQVLQTFKPNYRDWLSMNLEKISKFQVSAIKMKNFIKTLHRKQIELEVLLDELNSIEKKSPEYKKIQLEINNKLAEIIDPLTDFKHEVQDYGEIQ